MRTLCLLLLLLLTLLCGACTAGEADRQPATDAPLPPANRETTTPETTAQEPLLPLVLPEPVPLPAAQAPASLEATVLPLTNARGIYRSCIIGETAFVDLEGQRIALLPGVTEYHAIHDQVTDSVNGYALFNAQGRYALMNNQGRVVSDFIYEPFDPADGYVFWGGYAYAITTVTDPANDGYWPFYGLVDLRSGEEILPPRYGNLSLWPHHIVAQSDGMDQILDYQGNLLFEDQNLPTMESEDNLYFSARGASNYHYLASSGELFYYSEPENTLTIYEDFYIIRDDSSYNGTGMTISVYDKD